jgi:hypothetical protein
VWKKKNKNNKNSEKETKKNNTSPDNSRGDVITRFDCVWMQTQKSPNDPPYQNSGMWMQVSSLPTNSSLQNTPRYQFSLKSETIDNMTILLAAILKMVSS